jgi:hypothetical protein
MTYGELLAALYELTPSQLTKPARVSTEFAERDFIIDSIGRVPGDLNSLVLGAYEIED